MKTPSAIACYCNELAAEKALLALEPTSHIVPTTSTRITASIAAYSAMSCPDSSFQISPYESKHKEKNQSQGIHPRKLVKIAHFHATVGESR
jgi:hypothetical protein